MKYLVILLCLLSRLAAYAQFDSAYTDIDSSDYQFKEKWEQLFKHIPTDSATTNYITSRGLFWYKPEMYTGNPAVNDTSSMDALISLHQSFKTASIQSTDSTLFDSTDGYILNSASFANDSTLPLSALAINYNCIKPNAFTDSILYFDATDTAIKAYSPTSNPFLSTTLFAAAPVYSTLYQGSYKLVLPPQLFLTNTNLSVQIVAVKLGGESSYHTVNGLDAPIAVNWEAEAGEKLLYIKLQLSNGSWYESVSKLRFKTKLAPYSGIYANGGTTLNIAANSQHAGGQVSIRYGCGKTKLTKPLIVVEGFDPPEENSLNLSKLLLNIYNSDLNLKQRFQELEAQGYDLVYINYNNGSDSIERNTRLFMQIVQQINTIKVSNGSSESNIVMGFSMGGVIARLGLRQMELANLNHDTKLYISIDAPHKGAYVPHSIQHLVGYVSGIVNSSINLNVPLGLFYSYKIKLKLTDYLPTEAAKGVELINTVMKVAQSSAAKQMLIGNIYDVAVFGSVTDTLNPIRYEYGYAHKTFYHKYDSLGVPLNCEIVAISNGSIKGQKQHNDDGNEILNAASQIYTNQSKSLLYGFLSIDANLLLDLKGLPSSSSAALVCRLKLDFNINIANTFSIALSPINKSFVTSGPTLAYDNAPGGNSNLSSYLGDINSFKKMLNLGGRIDINIDRFCFVPTFSSLDITSINLYPDLTNTINASYSNAVFNNSYKIYHPVSGYSAFSSISAPNSSSLFASNWNETHITPTAYSGAIIGEAILGSIYQIGTPSLTTLNATSFNFGHKLQTSAPQLSSGNVLYNNLTINNGGTLYINGNMPLGFTSSTLPNPDASSIHQISTKGGDCGSPARNITVESTGYLILGDASNSLVGQIEVEDGSTVELKSVSNLFLYNESKIIFKTGSIFKVNNGANIILSDDNSILEFEPGSKIKLENGATFTFSGNGFIRVKGGALSSTNTTVGIEAPLGGIVSLSGNGKNDKILEFEASSAAENVVIIPSSLTAFVVNNGLIATNCNVDVSCNAQLYYSKITSIGNTPRLTFNTNYYSTFSDYNQMSLLNYANAEYNNGYINGNLEAWMIVAGSDKLKLESMIFNGVESNGLYVYDSRTDISNVSFTHNHIPMRFEAMSHPTTLTNVIINNPDPMAMPNSGGYGLYYEGASNGGYLLLDRCKILNQKASTLQVDNAQVAISCSKINPHQFANNNSSVYLTNGSTLVLDPTVVSNVGKSDLAGVQYAIVCNNAFDLFLDNGQSDLSVTQNDALNGNLQTLYNPGSSQFNASNNYWKWGTSPTRLNHYYYFTDGANRQFGINGNVNVDGNPYLTSVPDFDNLCPAQGSEPGGGGQQSKRSLDFEATFAEAATGIVFQNNLLTSTIYSLMNITNDSSDLESRINTGINVLGAYYNSNNLSLKRSMNILYQKTMEHSGRMINKCKSQSTKNRVGNKLYQLQTTILNQNQLSKHERFKFEMDRVFALRIQKKYNQSLGLLNILILDTNYNNYLNYMGKWICKIENEKQFDLGTISIHEFKSRLTNCSVITSNNNNSSMMLGTPDSQAHLSNWDVSLYPNPAQNQLEVSLTSADLAGSVMSIYSIDGRLISTEKISFTLKSKIIDVSAFANGTYIFELIHPNFKVIKRVSIMH